MFIYGNTINSVRTDRLHPSHCPDLLKIVAISVQVSIKKIGFFYVLLCPHIFLKLKVVAISRALHYCMKLTVQGAVCGLPDCIPEKMLVLEGLHNEVASFLLQICLVSNLRHWKRILSTIASTLTMCILAVFCCYCLPVNVGSYTQCWVICTR